MSLMRADLAPYSGDGLLVYDSDTRLEWLSLGLSLNHSCVDVRTMRFVTHDGFRFATSSDIGLLWTHAGIKAMGGPGPADAGTAIGVELLLRWLGGSTILVTSTPETVEVSRGLVPETSTFTPTTPVVAFDLHLNRTTTPAKAYGDSGAGIWNAGQRDESTGVYLVRTRSERP
jgi:hypothetical protein